MGLGFRVLTRRVRGGPFWCPAEQRERTHERLLRRYWFVLVVIPLVPMASAGEAIRCTSCGKEFPPDVLADAPAMFVVLEKVKLVRAIAQLLVGPDPDPHVVAEARDLLATHECGTPRLDGSQVPTIDAMAQYAAALRPTVPPGWAEELVAGAFAIAAADYRVDPHDVAVLSRLAHELGVPDDHVGALLDAHGAGG